jgi:hypothetical protein
MNPLYLFPFALIVPFIVAIVAFVPAYTGLFAATYFIYDRADAANPLTPYKYDVFYIFNVYSRLFSHWIDHIGASDFTSFTLPLIGAPLLGIGLSIFLTYKLVCMIINFFRMSTAV